MYKFIGDKTLVVIPLWSINCCQIVAEFERVLGLGTSVMDEFRANLDQVADGIIETAKKKRTRFIGQLDMFLNYLK